jgi:hypothetical protein
MHRYLRHLSGLRRDLTLPYVHLIICAYGVVYILGLHNITTAKQELRYGGDFDLSRSGKTSMRRLSKRVSVHDAFVISYHC